jgi:hypothetical protein
MVCGHEMLLLQRLGYMQKKEVKEKDYKIKGFLAARKYLPLQARIYYF